MRAVDYLQLLADDPRVDAFREAIELVVRPGQIVLDLGTGIGTYAMFAARAGATVYAVDGNPVIEIARQLAADNGLAERITFLEGWATDLEPPERADVLVFEDYAPYLCEPETELILEDLRRRWLKPGAAAVPRSIRVMLAPVSCPGTYGALVPWEEEGPYGFDISRLTHRVLNNLHPVSWGEEVLLAEAVEVATMNPVADERLGFSAERSWRAVREGTLCGLGMWLELELADGVVFSNAPSTLSAGWDQVLLPLTQPVSIRSGDPIEARVRTLGASSPGSDTWWTWRVKAAGQAQEMDTFRGAPLSMDRMRKAGLEHRPRLTQGGEIRRVALGLMDGRRSVAEIAAALSSRFPGRFESAVDAYRFLAAELEASGVSETDAAAEPAAAKTGGIRP